MLMPNIVDGSGLRSEPSMLEVHIMDGSIQNNGTFHAGGRYHGRFRSQRQTLHAGGPYHGRFWDTVTQILHMEATAGRQAGPFRSPAQSCRSVAAGGHIEATEKGPHNLRI